MVEILILKIRMKLVPNPMEKATKIRLNCHQKVVWFCSVYGRKNGQSNLQVYDQEWKVDVGADVSNVDVHS